MTFNTNPHIDMIERYGCTEEQFFTGIIFSFEEQHGSNRASNYEGTCGMFSTECASYYIEGFGNNERGNFEQFHDIDQYRRFMDFAEQYISDRR